MAARGWRVRRPEGLVASTRWLFCACVLLSMALTVPGVAGGQSPALVPPVLGAALLPCLVWVRRYRTGRAGLAGDVVEALATAALACLAPDPATVFGITFSAVWFRAVYGSARQSLVHALLLCGAVVAGLALWSSVPGHEGPVPVAPVLGALPTLLLTTLVARHLAAVLFAREQAQQRDEALSRLSTGLLAVTGREPIHDLAWGTVRDLCGATPGLRALVVARAGDDLEVVRATGLVAPPAALAGDVLPQDLDAAPAGSVVELPDPGGLNRAAGEGLDWVALPLPEQPGAWMVLGAPRRPSLDHLASVRSVLNQVALAIRMSDSHLELVVRASTDPLTGLANRAAFTRALETAALAPVARLAVLFLDLDDFKVVNDGMGHAAGDELLRHVATRLRSSVGDRGLCARLGGDEFAVLAVDLPEEEVARTSERLVEVVGRPLQVQGRSVRVGVSVGVATTSAAARDRGAPVDPGQLVQQADVAMYAAKARGKSRSQVFDASLARCGGTAPDDVPAGPSAVPHQRDADPAAARSGRPGVGPDARQKA